MPHRGCSDSLPARILAATGRETLAAFLASIPIAILGGTLLDAYGTSLSMVVFTTVLSWAAIIAVAYVGELCEVAAMVAPGPARGRDDRADPPAGQERSRSSEAA